MRHLVPTLLLITTLTAAALLIASFTIFRSSPPPREPTAPPSISCRIVSGGAKNTEVLHIEWSSLNPDDIFCISLSSPDSHIGTDFAADDDRLVDYAYHRVGSASGSLDLPMKLCEYTPGWIWSVVVSAHSELRRHTFERGDYSYKFATDRPVGVHLVDITSLAKNTLYLSGTRTTEGSAFVDAAVDPVEPPPGLSTSFSVEFNMAISAQYAWKCSGTRPRSPNEPIRFGF